jgi:hypothetical protein
MSLAMTFALVQKQTLSTMLPTSPTTCSAFAGAHVVDHFAYISTMTSYMHFTALCPPTVELPELPFKRGKSF